MFFEKKVVTVEEPSLLEKKAMELELLNSKSNSALNVVISTIDELTVINEQIDSTINEIEDAKRKLNETEDGLNKTKSHNSKIISKFKALIEE